MMKLKPNSNFDDYKQFVEQAIKNAIPLLGPSTPIREACQYALTNGGKRIRPIIVLLMADALKLNASVVPAALAIEYFHTASLVADDLPCMDDDDERRNHPSTHKKHGEAVALLVSYALIAAGYECLVANTKLLKSSALPHSSHGDQICVLALENATYNTGLSGATGGQFLDISPPDLEMQTLKDIIQKKTTSLFEVAFVFGWIFGGGSLDKLDEVKQLAAHFGMAFQIADDIDDVEQDAANNRKINMATAIGFDAAALMFHEEIKQYRLILNYLGVSSMGLNSIADMLEEKVLTEPKLNKGERF